MKPKTPLGYPASTKNYSPFGPAVWPASVTYIRIRLDCQLKGPALPVEKEILKKNQIFLSLSPTGHGHECLQKNVSPIGLAVKPAIRNIS